MENEAKRVIIRALRAAEMSMTEWVLQETRLLNCAPDRYDRCLKDAMKAREQMNTAINEALRAACPPTSLPTEESPTEESPVEADQSGEPT